MSVDFSNGFVLGLTAVGKYLYQAKQIQGFETSMPVINYGEVVQPIADNELIMPTTSVATEVIVW